MPREWGRDPFTPLCQRTNEGYGDVNAMIKYNTYNPQNTLKSHLAMGYF
jgi:hypothetical protein